jgi:hypothetical protein
MIQWRPIKGYEGYYEVSNFGDVVSITREIVRTNQFSKPYKKLEIGRALKKTKCKGYVKYALSKNGIRKDFYAHRLVYESFVGDIEKGKVINHIDGVKNNNSIENLELVSLSQNMVHAYRMGLKNPVKSKIPIEMAKKALHLRRNEKWTITQLQEYLNLSKSQVNRVLKMAEAY